MNPSYPIGEFAAPGRALSLQERAAFIGAIEAVPKALRDASHDLSPQQLSTPYRDGGWSVRQVVHHLPDSHMNAFVRFKLALTEEAPTIKTYDEARWAELEDVKEPIEVSLTLLESLHRRWVRLLRSLDGDSFARKLTHPDLGLIDLDHLLALYAWHGRHHVAQITDLRRRMGW